jgi:ribosomal protein S6--L-glutamate ligase
MSLILVVNGAYDWRPHFIGHRVVQTHVDRSRWVLDGGALWVVDARGSHRPDAILWRLGAVTPRAHHRACLELIRLSGLPCVNPADSLLTGYDRLSMLHALRQADLPVVDFVAYAGDGALEVAPPELPAVLKVGNLHGGLGKARAMDAASWAELSALPDLGASGYATAEPFVDYARDVRCMAVGDQVWAMERRGAGWKANVDTQAYDLVDPPADMARWTRRAMAHLGADVLGLDFLEAADGEVTLLESNDIPGVRGWPDAVPRAIAGRLLDRLAT